jgi:hypothetical protein
MKFQFKYLTGVVMVMLAMTSCKKNNLVVDQDPLIAPSYVKFNVLKAGDTLANYFIRSTNNALRIPVGVTTVSDVDRTIQLCYTSPTGAAAGVQYNAPASIVIPAGQTLDSITLQGLYTGYPTSTRSDTLRIKICGGDVPVNAYYSQFVVVMRKYCDVVINNFLGSYTNTRETNSTGGGAYGPYTTTVTDLVMVPGSSTKATVKLNNLYDDGWNPITATLDWTNPDPTKFSVTIASQPTGKSYNGAPTNVRTSTAGTSIFNSCDRSISLSIDLVNGTTVILSNYKINMK